MSARDGEYVHITFCSTHSITPNLKKINMLMNEYIIQHVNIRQLMQATNNAGHEYCVWLGRSQDIFSHRYEHWISANKNCIKFMIRYYKVPVCTVSKDIVSIHMFIQISHPHCWSWQRAHSSRRTKTVILRVISIVKQGVFFYFSQHCCVLRKY